VIAKINFSLDLWRFKLDWNESIPLELWLHQMETIRNYKSYETYLGASYLTNIKIYVKVQMVSPMLVKLHTEHAFTCIPCQPTFNTPALFQIQSSSAKKFSFAMR